MGKITKKGLKNFNLRLIVCYLQYSKRLQISDQNCCYCKSRMIGNRLERIRRQYTSRMNSMIKLDCDKNKHQLLIQTAWKHIKTLLFILRLPKKDIRAILTVFKDFHPKIQKKTKFRKPEKLVIIASFLLLAVCGFDTGIKYFRIF